MSEQFTADILQKIKLYLQSDLTGINTWKLGILPPVPVFPAIAILPTSENTVKYLSSGQRTTRRVYDLEIHTKGLSVEAVEKKNYELVNKLEELLRTNLNYNLRDTILDLVIGSPVSQVQPTSIDSSQFICTSILKVETFSKNYIANRLVGKTDLNSDTTNESASYTLLLKLFNFLKVLRTVPVTTYGLADVVVLEKNEIPATAKLPAVLVIQPDYDVNRKWAGMDSQNKRLEIKVLTRAVPQEAQLLQNLDITKRILQALEVYTYLSFTDDSRIQMHTIADYLENQRERIVNSTVVDVQYDISPDYFYYITTISLLVETRKEAIFNHPSER